MSNQEAAQKTPHAEPCEEPVPPTLRSPSDTDADARKASMQRLLTMAAFVASALSMGS